MKNTVRLSLGRLLLKSLGFLVTMHFLSAAVLAMVVLMTGCSVEVNMKKKSSTAQSDSAAAASYSLKIDKSAIPNSRIEITEGSAVAIVVVINQARADKDSLFLIDLTATNSGSVASRFQSFTTGFSIPAGSTSAMISLTSIDDQVFEGASEDFTFSIISADSKVSVIDGNITIRLLDNELAPTLAFSTGTQNISENAGTSTLTVNLSQAAAYPISVDYAVSGGTAPGSDYSLTSGTLNFSAGQTSKTISMSITDDAVYTGDRTVAVDLSNAVSASLGTITSQTVTIVDDEPALGAFNISGISASTGDSALDAYLVNNTMPTISWEASTNASSYDVTIYANDGVTTVCATQNTVLTSLNMGAGCTLTAGNTYKAKVVAKSGTVTMAATNSLYSFYVNQSPTLGTGGEGPWYVMQGGSITIDALWAASPGVGVATDPESDSLSFTSVDATGTLGGTISSSGTSIIYTAGASLAGKDTLTYTITDSKGGTLTGTITIHVMTAFSWTGKTSAAWGTVSNWCGSISADKKSCAGGASLPTTTSVIVFNDTCTSSFSCTPTTSANISVSGVIITANGFTQGTGYSITVGGSHWNQSGGTFTGGNSTISMSSASLNISGGTFTSTSGTLGINRSLTVSNSPTFNHNNGLLYISISSSSQVITPGNFVWKNFSINAAGNIGFQLVGTMTVLGTMTVNGDMYSMGGGTINLYGDLTIVGANGKLSASNTIRLVGGTGSNVTVTGSSSGSRIGSLEIASLGTVTFVDTVSVGGNYTYTSGTLITTGSTLKIANGANQSIIPGNIAYNNVTIGPHSGGSNYNLNAETITILGSLTLNSSGALNNGIANVSGDLNILGNSFSGGTATIRLVGDVGSNVLVTGSGTGSKVGNLEIASLGTVNFANTGSIDLSSAANFTYTSGVVVATGSTVRFYGGYQTITPGNIQFNNVTFIATSSTSTLAGGTMTVLGNLVFSSSGCLNTGTVYLAGNLSLTGTSCSGTAAIYFNGTLSQTVTQTGGSMPSGNITINNAAGISLATNVTWNGTSQVTDVIAGGINQAGFNLTLKSLSLNGNTLTKNAGVLTVNGSVVGTGALYGGTIDP